MCDRKINSLFEPTSQNRNWASGWLGIAMGVICVSTFLGGCSGPGKLEETIPFERTAAELKQAFSQTQESTFMPESNRAFSSATG